VALWPCTHAHVLNQFFSFEIFVLLFSYNRQLYSFFYLINSLLEEKVSAAYIIHVYC
jgi:hypothetical protein